MSLARTHPELLAADGGGEVSARQYHSPSVVVPFKTTELTKTAQLSRALELVNRMKENSSSLQSYVILKDVAEVVGQAMEVLKDDAIAQFQPEGREKHMTLYGVKITTPRDVRYDYDHDSEVQRLKTLLKARQDFLKNLPPQGSADPETGEITMPAKKVKDGVKLSITFS